MFHTCSSNGSPQSASLACPRCSFLQAIVCKCRVHQPQHQSIKAHAIVTTSRQQAVAQRCALDMPRLFTTFPPSIAVLVAMLLRLAKLRPPPPRQAKEQLLPEIWHHLYPHLQTLQLHELSLALWAAAKLDYNQPALYRICLQLFLRQLDSAPARHVSNVMYALAAAPLHNAAQHDLRVLPQLLPAFVKLAEAGEVNPQV